MNLKRRLKSHKVQRCQKCKKVGHETGNCAVNIQEIIYQLDEDEKKYVTRVSIRRSSDKWQIDIPLNYDKQSDTFRKKIYFDLGQNEFKFVLNNREWKVGDLYMTISNNIGDLNNVIHVKPINKAPVQPIPFRSLCSEVSNVKKQKIEFNVSYLELLENEELRDMLGKWDFNFLILRFPI